MVVVSLGMSRIEGYKDITIPGLISLSISVMMIGLLYSTKKRLDEGKVKKDIWQVTCILGLLGAISNFVIGIVEIVNVILK